MQQASPVPLGRWAIRIAVLAAFAATVWLAGPRASAVLAAKFDKAAQQSPLVVLDRVGFASRPDWLDEPLLVAVARDLAPWLQDELPILDEVAMRRLVDGLRTVPWVAEARLERVFPDRCRLQVDLRRPILAVVAGDGQPLCLVDRHGIALPWVESVMPVTWLHPEAGWSGTAAVVPGEAVDEPRVRAAIGIALEWRDELAPTVPGCPALLEIDATNLGERFLRGRFYPEIRVKLRRDDGAGVIFAYDRPVDSPLPRVPIANKATVLTKVLGAYPGLRGLVAGDLRLVNRPFDYLQPRPAGVDDPDGPWAELPLPIPAEKR